MSRLFKEGDRVKAKLKPERIYLILDIKEVGGVDGEEIFVLQNPEGETEECDSRFFAEIPD